MVVPLIAAAVLALHSAPWRHVVVTRSSGPISATLAFDARPDPFGGYGERQIRRVTLLMRRGRTLLLARKLSHASGSRSQISLRLNNVWGNSEPEALVKLVYCGNRCFFSLYVATPAGRLLFHEFGVNADWQGERRNGQFEFVTVDGRFFCNFASCAAATMPVQVLEIDPTGNRFVDISRKRPDLLRLDAARQQSAYIDERKIRVPGPPQWYGAFVPYCADEYRLGVYAYCDRVLPSRIKRQLTAWGYR